MNDGQQRADFDNRLSFANRRRWAASVSNGGYGTD